MQYLQLLLLQMDFLWVIVVIVCLKLAKHQLQVRNWSCMPHLKLSAHYSWLKCVWSASRTGLISNISNLERKKAAVKYAFPPIFIQSVIQISYPSMYLVIHWFEYDTLTRDNTKWWRIRWWIFNNWIKISNSETSGCTPRVRYLLDGRISPYKDIGQNAWIRLDRIHWIRDLDNLAQTCWPRRTRAIDSEARVSEAQSDEVKMLIRVQGYNPLVMLPGSIIGCLSPEASWQTTKSSLCAASTTKHLLGHTL